MPPNRGGFRGRNGNMIPITQDHRPRSGRPTAGGRRRPCVLHGGLTSGTANFSRIDFSSSRRSALGFGYDILRVSKVSRMIWEMISRAFFLSSAGTTYHGASLVLVAP